MAWTDERVDKLRELWAEGLTASQIAKALGGVSRNAVIGKVHRLGLSNRTGAGKAPGAEVDEEASSEVVESTPVERKAAEPVVETAAPAVAEVETKAEAPAAPAPAETTNPVAALVAEVEKSARKLTLLELNERTCKWPIGDPSTSDFYFCGLQCAPDKPYCSAHVSVAYQPMSSRRDRDRGRTRAISA